MAIAVMEKRIREFFQVDILLSEIKEK